MDAQNISAWLFIASTGINIYLGFRLAKFENAMKKYIKDEINDAVDSIEDRAKEARHDFKEQVFREIDNTNRRLDRIQNGK